MRKVVAFAVLVLGSSGCFSEHGSVTVPKGGVDYAHEGVAPHVWEEPMVDVVEVPPGLDPEGHYYRPAHKEVVEVRQGRWQHYKNRDQ